MTVKSKYLKVLSFVCAAVLMIAALSVCAFAAGSIQDEMAANSAAWWVAHDAGDTATCAALEAANQALAAQLANGGGNAEFDTETGTWNITTASGDTIASSGGGSNGKTTDVNYTTITNAGNISMTTGTSYTDSSINAYYQYGGNDQGLQDAYNNAAYNVSTSGNYGDQVAVTSAAAEIAVAKKLLGLTDAEAASLQAELELSKQAYEAAQTQYDAAIASGDTAAAEAAQAKMVAAHDAAQESRAKYNYTGDSTEVNDGGYYYGGDTAAPSGSGGGWYFLDIAQTYNITTKTNEGGKIDPNGTVAVKKGTDKTFEITPNEGYKIAKILVDDVEVEVTETYTFENVQKAHTIDVTFEKAKLEISASAGNGGTISPSGSVKVNYGESKTFTIQPNDGYEIEKVFVDGVNKGAISSYTFSDVKEAHTISAVFDADGTVKLGAATVTDSLGKSLAGGSIKSGYGFMVKVPVTADGVTDVKVTVSYNFGYGKKTVTLVKVGSDYVFPKNSSSPTDARCVYIPVATKDATYTLTVSVTAKNYDGETVSDSSTATVTVKGNMHEDDFTGDS